MHDIFLQFPGQTSAGMESYNSMTYDILGARGGEGGNFHSTAAAVEGRGIKLCIIEIDNQLVRSESMQNSKTQRGNKHLCESSWTN